MLTWLGPVSVVASDLEYESIMDCPYQIVIHVIAPYSPTLPSPDTCTLLSLLSFPFSFSIRCHVVGTSPRLQVLETISPCCMQQTSIPAKTLIRQPINKEQPESSSNECCRQHSSLIASPTLPQHLLHLLISLPAALFNLGQPATQCCFRPALLIA